jgi:hypothetical protein
LESAETEKLAREFSLLGAGSLIVDGEADEVAAWREALKRVDDEDQLCVRGIARGNSQVLRLLESGVEPGYVVCIAPPRVEEFASSRFPKRMRWGTTTLIFLDTQRESVDADAWERWRSDTRAFGAVVLDDDRTRFELAAAALAPLELERELFFWQSPFLFTGCCVLRLPMETLDVPQLPPDEMIDVRPDGTVQKGYER